MNLKELLELSENQNVDIALHLPGYKGMKLILVDGMITTQGKYDECEIPLCHLFEDGIIRRRYRKIGSFADIEVLNIIDLPD